jgi:nitrate reductase gamma subunit
MMVIQLVTYGSVIIAIVAMIAKAMRYATAPEHFRWELYPVPHEKGRAEYGGSYLEELDWWTKPRHSDMLKELKEMMAEIFLLKGVFHNNKRVWTSSFPFHFGMYLCIGWLGLLLLGAILQKSGVEIAAKASTIGVIVHYLTIISGYAGLVLAGLGALGLIIWRASDPRQKAYNSPAEYVNLLFFDIVVVIALLAQLTADPSFMAIRAYVESLITFTSAPALPALTVIEIILGSLLIMYIPLTRMSHFVAKYFLYHSVRWNDEPNPRGSTIEKHIAALLQKKVGWKASHISTGKSWVEVVKETDNE